jgi:hypothetical protein
MNDLQYCLYAFVQPKCRVEEIGAGVDPRYRVELIREGPVAAVASRIGLDQFVPERLQGKTRDDIRWLGKIAARHNEIICQAAATSAVLPLRLGTVFHSRESLHAALLCRQTAIGDLLRRFGNRREWGIKLYVERDAEDKERHSCLPPPHFLALRRENTPPREGCEAAGALSAVRSGTAYMSRQKTQIETHRRRQVNLQQAVRSVEQCLANQAEHSCRIRGLPAELTGRSEEMVFNAAFLLPSSAQDSWLETVERIGRDVQRQGLLLEVSGPWPPYHFCPNLEMQA